MSDPRRPPPITSWIHDELPPASRWEIDSDNQPAITRPAPIAPRRRRVNVTTVAVLVIAAVVVSFAWYELAHQIECGAWRDQNAKLSYSLNPDDRWIAAADREIDPHGCR